MNIIHTNRIAAGLALLLAASSSASAQPAEVVVAPPAGPDVPQEYRGGAPLLQLGAANILRTSHVAWTTSVTSETFENDEIASDGEHTIMAFSLVPRFSFIDTARHWAWAGTDIVMHVELTDGNTVKKHELLVDDLPIDLAYNYVPYREEGGFTLFGGPRARIELPTSSVSSHLGIAAKTTFGLGAAANIPLLSGEGLNSLFIAAGGTFRHTFSGTTPQAIPAGGFVRDEYRLAIDTSIAVWGDLSLGNTLGASWRTHDGFNGSACDIQTITGCTAADTNARATSSAARATTFALSLSYALAKLVIVEVGYDNTSPSIGENGQDRPIFHGPDALFYVTSTLLLDGMFERLVPRDRGQDPSSVARLGSSALR